MTVFEAPLRLDQLGVVLGRYRYVELKLFETVGRAVPVCSDPSLSVVLSEASHAHAYRARQIEELLLVSAGLPDAAASTVPADEAHRDVLVKMEDLDPKMLASSLVNLWYPLMAESYQQHLKRCARASDGSVRRMLVRLIFDLGSVTGELGAVGGNTGSDSSDLVAQYDDERRSLEELDGPFGTRWS
jgi:hypothetical protein